MFDSNRNRERAGEGERAHHDIARKAESRKTKKKKKKVSTAF